MNTFQIKSFHEKTAVETMAEQEHSSDTHTEKTSLTTEETLESGIRLCPKIFLIILYTIGSEKVVRNVVTVMVTLKS